MLATLQVVRVCGEYLLHYEPAAATLVHPLGITGQQANYDVRLVCGVGVAGIHMDILAATAIAAFEGRGRHKGRRAWGWLSEVQLLNGLVFLICCGMLGVNLARRGRRADLPH
ncbi:unnamed protein product [Ostreobium quekettii]|uniref:Uncharacterized protein n=1 Tax=Ostreobium quekettii TaxID=121088 RepID=A0A8S1IPF4_9CHLO|nr:unnamed protein product [Ostreobium quekettii]